MDVYDSSSVLPCLPVSIRGGSWGSVEKSLIKEQGGLLGWIEIPVASNVADLCD